MVLPAAADGPIGSGAPQAQTVGMRHRMWSAALVGVALGSLAMVGGTVIGGDVGPLAVGYGLLVALAGLYLVTGLAIRERARQRLNRPAANSLPPIDRLAGRRVF